VRKAWVISALLLVAAALAPAQQQPATPVTVAVPMSAPEPPPVKVATIFGQNALASTQEGQKATQALTTKFAPQREAFERKQTELQSLRDQLKKGQATLSPEARDRLTRDIDAKTKEAERLGEDSQTALQHEEGALMQELGDKLMAVIQQYAASHALAFVIDVSVPNGPVLWASPSIDITNEIVRLYDQAHPVQAAAAAAPPSKK
jgi:outer membrane protein